MEFYFYYFVLLNFNINVKVSLTASTGASSAELSAEASVAFFPASPVNFKSKSSVLLTTPITLSEAWAVPCSLYTPLPWASDLKLTIPLFPSSFKETFSLGTFWLSLVISLSGTTVILSPLVHFDYLL